MNVSRYTIFFVAMVTCILVFFFVELTIGAEIDRDAARLNCLDVGGKQMSLGNAGGFTAYDVTNKKRILFDDGSLTKSGKGTIFRCKQAELAVSAEFRRMSGFILVEGHIENLNAGDRAIILDYRIVSSGEDGEFCNSLNKSVNLSDGEQKEGNVFPIAAFCTNDQGIAMAIPPDSPMIFGMVGSKNSLAVRLYLGLTSQTKKFPNRASFKFIIYPVDSDWGFRSALSKYYSFFPEYYTQEVPRDGLWMFSMKGRTPSNIKQYGFHEIGIQADTFAEDIARDEKYGILTFPYTIVGQREVKFLDKLPEDYQEAVEAYEKWSYEQQSKHPATKENSLGDDIWLKQVIKNCAARTVDGKYSLIIRPTAWGQNTVTFRINPNPDLFAGEGKKTVGVNTLEVVKKWILKHPQIDGIYVDSLGRMWPAILNYRKDHFQFARYPLTFDPNGRIALHNQLSHYAFLQSLREELRARNKFLFANGIYSYNVAFDNYHLVRSKAPEHYNARKLGRFFMAALLDVAGSEAGVNPPQERWEFARVCMGKKLHLLLNYNWEDKEKVMRYINKALLYCIFATNSGNIGKEYLTNADGHALDKNLFNWFVPKVRRLSRAGWEPVTFAKTNSGQVLIERYGKKDKTVYFAVHLQAEEPQDCTVTFDLQGLGLSDKCILIDEIAKGKSVNRPKPDQVELSLEPFETCILSIKTF